MNLEANMREKIVYSNWRDEYGPILQSFHGKRILFSLSGGKDSSLSMDFMLRGGEEFDFSIEAHVAAFPIHRYTQPERERIGSYWRSRGVDLVWHDFLERDEQIRDTVNPCHSCQKIRKTLLKTMVAEKVDDLENLVLIVNFSLWDIVGYSLEHILADIYPKAGGKGVPEKSKRFMETAQRFYPLLKMKEGYTVFRPLVKYNGCDVLYTIEESGIPILSIPCEFKEYRPKRIFENYYEKMGLRFDYERVFRFSKTALDLPEISSFSSLSKEVYLKDYF